jgi:long-subunit fatty acid transport protein
MKKITTLTFIALISLGLNAQSLLPIKYGIKVGSNIANVISTANDGVENIESSGLIGVAGGFYMEIPLNDKWQINPEIIYAQKGAAFTYSYTHNNYIDNEKDLHSTSHELKLAYVELNPTISYKTSTKLSLNFGPSIAYLITPSYSILSDIGEDEAVTSHEELPVGEYKEEDLDVGLNIGISYYLTENFLIDGKVNTGFMSLGKVSKNIYTVDSANNDSKSNIYDLKNTGIVLSIAYLF